ncbi:MAG TPA: hypothetical protein VGW38_06355 [Chloroflexota bacterium]|nr:hypothetical protein [Chloroflexota bacterium]
MSNPFASTKIIPLRLAPRQTAQAPEAADAFAQAMEHLTQAKAALQACLEGLTDTDTPTLTVNQVRDLSALVQRSTALAAQVQVQSFVDDADSFLSAPADAPIRRAA